jgi:predicted DNA-binding transcriptional regulator YafY
MPPLVFTSEEAVAVYLGTSLVEEMWGKLYQEAAHGALAKLDNVLPDEQHHEIAWARRSLLATGMHRANLGNLTPTLEKLRRAVRQHRRVRMVYQSRNQSEPAPRELDPYALVHRWGWWYVIGYCHLRQAERTFRVDRIEELTLLESTFDLPTYFNLQAYLQNEPQAQPLLTARLRFLPEAAKAVSESQMFWERIAVQPDGSLIVTYPAPTLEWAASTALAFGPVVEVLEPPELRQIVADWAAKVINRYAPEQTSGQK